MVRSFDETWFWHYPRYVTRHCYRQGCRATPVSTLTYDYAHSTATIGPLSSEHEPGGYDLCLEHARNMQVPAGWHLERVANPVRGEMATATWLASLADEVRRIGWRDEPPARVEPDPASVIELARRGHLRVIADAPSAR
ncbi:MAG: DUF3499 domain-containing protein [Propionibacteriaceae bacterium]|nr:DUF3499 domain-containing protein [Propionibacteriaceae bacterium]